MNKTLIASALLACIATACSAKTEAEAAAAPVADAAPVAEMPAAMPAANPMVGGAEMFADKDIIDNAVNSKDHSTLVAAVKAAGLAETLKGAGPSTVFAPTNAAFDALPAGTVDTLLKPEMKGDLTKVLTYHVVPGKVMATDVKAGKVKTVQGQELTVSTGMGVTVDQSKIIATDVAASNGVIHAIDTVMMPK